TIGASHSVAEARQSSRLIMSLRLVEYSRMRPHPVQVRLHVCRGSSCRTMANFGVRRNLCLTIWLAILADSARGKRIAFKLLVCLGNALERLSRGMRSGSRQPRMETRRRSGFRGCWGRGQGLPEEAGQKESGGRHAVCGVNAAASCAQYNKGES